MSDAILIAMPVSKALAEKMPVVALESAVISHGLPYPRNLETALAMEEIIEKEGVVPATIGIVSGTPKVGLGREDIQLLARGRDVHKVTTRDLAIARAGKRHAGTTVSASVYLAQKAGIQVLATGGIGGMHLGNTADISADLPQLARTPILVICSGAKSILDLPATREWLETHSIPVIGYKTQELSGFYSRHTGLSVDLVVEEASEVREVWRSHRDLGMSSAMLITVPVPEAEAVSRQLVEQALSKALAVAEEQGISGGELTPFFLSRLGELTGGATTRANIALLKENARVAAQIARALNEA